MTSGLISIRRPRCHSKDRAYGRSWCNKKVIINSVFEPHSYIFPDFRVKAIQSYVHKIYPLFFLCDIRVFNRLN